MRIKGSSKTAVLLAAACLLGSCSSVAPEAASTSSIFNDVVSEAQSGGAGDSQLAALKDAREDQVLKLEPAREAARSAVQCMVESGLEAVYVEVDSFDGTTTPGYQVVATSDDQMEACDTLHFYWISKLYQLQPSSIQAREEYANQQESGLRSCLVDNGVESNGDETGAELANLAVVAAPNCLAEVGIDAW